MQAIPGLDKYLYRCHALNLKGKKLATVYAIGYTKFDAITSAQQYFPAGYAMYDYDHIRPARPDEAVGVVLKKNDRKRKNRKRNAKNIQRGR